MRQIEDYIEANLDQNLSLVRLAEVAALGPSHFKALFRHTTGLPVHRYVLCRPLERARWLLQRGELPVAQVALETGFSNQSHLACHMRRAFGFNPSLLMGRRD